MLERVIEGAAVRLVQGDLTRQAGLDAIVNAANEDLVAGGGVCGAIFRAAGVELPAACAAVVASRGRLKAGEAALTTAGALELGGIIHAVGPRWGGGVRGENIQLEAAWRSALEVAAEAGLRRVGFPSISTGIFAFPVDRAAQIALATVGQWLKANPGRLDEVRVVLFTAEDLQVYAHALTDVARTQLGE